MGVAISRKYNFGSDQASGIAISDVKVDAELDQLVASDNKKVQVKATAPSSPTAGDSWIDTSSSPYRMKVYDGSTWNTIGVVSSQGFSNLLKNGSFESWSGGTSAMPDGWTEVDVTQTNAKDTTNVRYGVAAFKITTDGTNDGGATQSITISATQNTILRSRKVTAGCWVKSDTASRVTVVIADGVSSSASSANSGTGWELLTVTRTLDASATKLEIQLTISAGSAVITTFDGAFIVEGSDPIAFSPHPNDEHLRISNYQDTTPTNNTDQGVWRTEIGQVNTLATGGKTVTFQTAFRAVRAFYATVEDSATAAFCTYSALGTSSVIVHGWDTAGARVAETASWMVIGQV